MFVEQAQHIFQVKVKSSKVTLTQSAHSLISRALSQNGRQEGASNLNYGTIEEQENHYSAANIKATTKTSNGRLLLKNDR